MLKDAQGNKFYFDKVQADVPCSGIASGLKKYYILNINNIV